MTVEFISALNLNVPEWFERRDFQAWLNAPGRATWHRCGQVPGDYSDTFILFDNDGEDGSDFDELFPEELRLKLKGICRQQGFLYGILRLTNMQE